MKMPLPDTANKDTLRARTGQDLTSWINAWSMRLSLTKLRYASHASRSRGRLDTCELSYRDRIAGARFTVLGTELTARAPELARELVQARFDHGGTFVCVTSVHGVVEACHSPDLRAAFDASLCNLPDGRPLALCGRFSGVGSTIQCRGADLLRALLSTCEADGLRIMFCGTTPAKLSAITGFVARTYPGLLSIGGFAPPFGDVSTIIDASNDSIRA